VKIDYNPAHDLLNIEFLANVAIDDSVEIDGVVVDYAKDKRIVAIEVLDASKRTPRRPLDLTNLAIVKSSGSDAVREGGEPYGGPGKGKTKRPGESLAERLVLGVREQFERSKAIERLERPERALPGNNVFVFRVRARRHRL
jgi:uncharacterized protein YuzE